MTTPFYPPRRRLPRILGRAALVLLVLLASAELVLRVGSLLVRDKSGAGWKPGATTRVLAIGDSHTYGGTVAPEQTYPAQLQRWLDEAHPGVYSVVNLGIPGMNTAQLRNRFALNLARWDPDVVVVWCGANNAWNSAEMEGGGPGRRLDTLLLHSKVYKLGRVLWNDRFLNQQTDARLVGQRHSVEQVDRQTKRSPFLGEIRQEDRREEKVDEEAFRAVRDDLAALAAMARAAGVRIVFITYPLDFERFRIVNRALGELAEEQGVEVVDGSAGHERVPGEDNRYTWALHPSAAVYGEIARDVAARILAPTPAR